MASLGKLFRRDMDPRCAYCERGQQINEREVACVKRGIVPAESQVGIMSSELFWPARPSSISPMNAAVASRSGKRSGSMPCAVRKTRALSEYSILSLTYRRRGLP